MSDRPSTDPAPSSPGFLRRRFNKARDRTKAFLGVRHIATVTRTTERGLKTIFRHRDYRQETFAQAVARQGLRPADLARAYRANLMRHYTFLLATLVSLATALLDGLDGRYLAMGSALGLTSVLLTLAIQASWSCWRIQTRRLEGLHGWLRDPLHWLPGPYRP